MQNGRQSRLQEIAKHYGVDFEAVQITPDDVEVCVQDGKVDGDPRRTVLARDELSKLVKDYQTRPFIVHDVTKYVPFNEVKIREQNFSAYVCNNVR